MSFNEMTEGEYVVSKAGRDQGSCFIVLKSEADYVYLVNGRQRRVEKPKKKKFKHVCPSKCLDVKIAKKIIANEKISNSEIRKSISKYLEEASLKEEV